jgi:hypothetical protein
MEKFSNLKPEKEKKDESKFKNDNFSIIDYNKSDIILSKDELVILPYFKDDGFILMKYEKTPAFSYKYKDLMSHKNNEFFIRCIKGYVNNKENAIQNVRRMLFEQTGLVLGTNTSIEIDKILFKTDVNTGQYHFCILNLSYSDYQQTTLKYTDENKIIKISLGDLDELKTHDLVTDYMLLKFKYEINI